MDAFEGRDERRKSAIEDGTALLPVFFVGGDSEVGLGRKKVIEAAFLDAGAIANIIHAHGSVALAPDKIESHREEVFFGSTGTAHKRQ